MWLLILAGLLAVSAGKEAASNAAQKIEASSSNADDIVMLEIDVKEPVKRSPISTSGDYGAPSNEYILQPVDGTQELPPEYLSILQQYAQEQQQAPPPQRRPQPAYARQQQALQQAYYNYRKPAVVPPRPRAQPHPQALAQAEVAAEIQAQIDAQNRADALRTARLGYNAPSSSTYESEPKLGTFEQELLQLVSANQAQEFKLLPTQPKGSPSPYSQQLVSYPAEYAKPAPAQLPEQYHIETSPPRYQQHQPVAAYQSVEVPAQYQAVQPAEYGPRPVKAFSPSPQYDYDAETELKSIEQAQAQAEAQAIAQAQALAQYHKLAQAAYKKQSALEHIQQGAQVSDAGRSHLQEQLRPKSADAAYRAKLKAQAAAEAAHARKLQHQEEFKAHADAIKKLEAQQKAHLKIQEEVHNFALNFEENQMRAQALAQAQAEALYKAHQQSRNEVNNRILAITKGQAQGKKIAEGLYHHSPSSTTPLPLVNSYFTNDQLQKYQASGSSYVPRSVPKPDDVSFIETAQANTQPGIAHHHHSSKLKIPAASQSVYISESGIPKKSPVKSLTIEGIVEPDQINRQVLKTVLPKGQTLTEEDLSALINAGYTVTPVSNGAKPTAETYAVENSSANYYTKKHKVAGPEYVTYEEVIQRPRKLIRKSRPILKPEDKDEGASEKVTFLVPLESSFGTRQPSLKHEE